MARIMGQTATVKRLWLRTFKAVQAADDAIAVLVVSRANLVDQLGGFEQLMHPEALKRMRGKYPIPEGLAGRKNGGGGEVRKAS